MPVAGEGHAGDGDEIAVGILQGFEGGEAGLSRSLRLARRCLLRLPGFIRGRALGTLVFNQASFLTFWFTEIVKNNYEDEIEGAAAQ